MRDSHAAAGWRIVALLCVTYCLSQFYRAANAVIGPDISRELAFGPSDLAIVTGSFFIAFAAVQPFVGVLLDRFGPRLTMSALMVLGVIGAGLFSTLDGVLGLSFARVLLGIGNSALLIGPMVVFARWFPPERFAFLSSLLIAVGTLGSLLATAPLAAAASAWGWRGAFLGMTGITALFTLLVFLVTRDAPPGHPFLHREPERLIETIKGLGQVLRNRRMYLIFAMNLTAYASTITILGLWGGPYLADIHGLDTIARGNVLLAMAVGSVIGYLVWGPLDRVLDTRKWLIVAGSAGIVLVLAALAAMSSPSLTLVTGLLAAQGLLAGCFVHVLSHGRAVFPEELVGRGLTVLNFGTMFGSFAMQYLTAQVIGAFTPTAAGHPPEEAYRAMFATMAAILFVAILIYGRIDDARPSQDRKGNAS